MGLIAGFVYISAMFVFIPVPFIPFFKESIDFRFGWEESSFKTVELLNFPHEKVHIISVKTFH
jgi:hypothetical protein